MAPEDWPLPTAFSVLRMQEIPTPLLICCWRDTWVADSLIPERNFQIWRQCGAPDLQSNSHFRQPSESPGPHKKDRPLQLKRPCDPARFVCAASFAQQELIWTAGGIRYDRGMLQAIVFVGLINARPILYFIFSFPGVPFIVSPITIELPERVFSDQVQPRALGGNLDGSNPCEAPESD